MFNVIIMGAAGRDFHNFRTFIRQHPAYRVVAFTATQIPFIETRTFPASMAGPDYSDDIPIYSESRLTELIKDLHVDFVFFSYSDIAHEDVMHKASLVQAAGASFVLLGPAQTELHSSKPVVALTATRTGAGKSPLTQFLARNLTDIGIKVVTIRHPMPYGNLQQQAVQRFATYEDFDKAECTIEEREEYEPYVRQGLIIYAGVDYEAVLRAAEQEADLILWDGGNNDFPFIAADINIAVCDALRAGHESRYYPGETNVRRADIVVLSKVSHCDAHALEALKKSIRQLQPEAAVIEADLAVTVSQPEQLRGKKVVVVEDGPTVTHGGMSFGAGFLMAEQHGAEIIDPRPYATGTIKQAFEQYPHLEQVLPALGYSAEQVQELRETIEASGAEMVIDGSPADLERLLKLSTPVVATAYRFNQLRGPDLLQQISALVQANELAEAG